MRRDVARHLRARTTRARGSSIAGPARAGRRGGRAPPPGLGAQRATRPARFLRPCRWPPPAGRFAAAWAGAGGREACASARSTRSSPATRPSPTPSRPGASPARRRVPLVVDMMISLADTLGGDRALAGRGAAAAAGGGRPRQPAARRPGPRRHARRRGLAGRSASASPRSRIAVVPGGRRARALPGRARRRPGPPHALFYGKLAPLHGVADRARRRPPARRAARCG